MAIRTKGAGTSCCADPRWSYATMRCEVCGSRYLYDDPASLSIERIEYAPGYRLPPPPPPPEISFADSMKGDFSWPAEWGQRSAEYCSNLMADARALPERHRLWRDQLWQIMKRGWCRVEAIEDNVLTVEMAKGMGWVQDPLTEWWHAPGLVPDFHNGCYVAPPAPPAAEPACGFPANALKHST